MKVYIGPYRDRWISTIHDRYMKHKYGYNDWPETQTRFEDYLEKFEDALQWLYNHSINLILDKRESQKIRVRIDCYDTWSMDDTLAHIIVPMLKQLKETNHGAPFVDMEDVPKELRATKKQIEAYSKNGDVDPKHFERWDWILGEMIWAFEQKCRDDWESEYYKFEEGAGDGFPGGYKLVWENPEGRKKHQERMTNGFRLFGKYYENLWD